jgi:TolB-like protein/class 3 adenylate cyclase
MVQDRPALNNRRLSAILAADVAGYSRLMHADEEGTHTSLTALMADVVYPAIAEHGGRIVKCTGDGFLAEFASAVAALRAAEQFQRGVRDQTIDDPDAKRILFRVGINVGDVIVEPHDIFGDDVNIAARLEGISEPGGIIVSSSIYDHVRGRTAVEFAALGDLNLKNISHPIRAYAVVTEQSAHISAVAGMPQTGVSPPRISIVVLPFGNLSGEPEQDHFVDGITGSLTTDLSRLSGCLVISSNSAFSYKGKPTDVRQIGRELNIHYVLEGSVQRSGDRLRVNVQLVDAKTASHLWAERFEKPIADLFDMQDEIVSRLANTLDVQFIVAEAARAERSLHPDVLDLTFQGLACLYKGPTPEHLAQARNFFERAISIDPRNVRAMVGLAIVDFRTAITLLTAKKTALFAAATTNAAKALSLSPDDTLARLVLAGVHIMTNRAAEGIAECEHILAIDRNCAWAHSSIGVAKITIGRAAETEGHVQEAFRLSPRDTLAHQWMDFVGTAKIHLGLDAEAADWLRRSIEANRNYPPAHFSLAAALGQLGASDEARTAAQAGLVLDAGFTIRRFRAGASSNNPTYLAGRERLIEGMRLAGIPEG